MPCRSEIDLVQDYGPNWRNFVTITGPSYATIEECQQVGCGSFGCGNAGCGPGQCGGPVLGYCPIKYEYFWGPLYDNVPQGQEIIASRQTFTIPSTLKLPVLIRGCGCCDDGVAINGTRLSGFCQNPSDIIVNTRTITIGTWNDGGPSVCGTTFCFYEAPPCPGICNLWTDGSYNWYLKGNEKSCPNNCDCDWPSDPPPTTNSQRTVGCKYT